MELFTMSAVYIGLLFGSFVAVKCIILPGLNNRFGQDTPRQVILPTNTPRGIAENDCLLGATATLTHLVNRRNEVRPLAPDRRSTSMRVPNRCSRRWVLQ